MKLFLVGVAVTCQLATLTPRALCQDSKPASDRLHVMATRSAGRVMLEADNIERGVSYPSVIQLKGNVQIKTRVTLQENPLSLMIMVVRADEADYHEDTGEIEARGNVHVDYRDDPAKPQAAGNVRIKLEPAR
jgi:lipopolysaccharide assembly outer membrane protein LptD (OstA)